MFEGLIKVLKDNGINAGTDLLLHSSFSAIRQMAVAKQDVENRVIASALTQRLYHEFGDILVPTEFISDYVLQSLRQEVLECRAPSTRGYFTNAFLNLPAVQRSKNPIYNIAAYGDKYSEAIANHINLEFTMDRGSPWAKFADDGGKVLFLGAGLHSCSIIHIVEYQMGLKYPRPVFAHKPYPFLIRDGRAVTKMYGYVHAIRWGPNTVERFLRSLNKTVNIFRELQYRRQTIYVLDAQLLQRELQRLIVEDVSWYDWEAKPDVA